MTQTYRYASIVICIASSTLAQAASPLEDVLSRPILETNTTQRETIRLVAPKVPTMPECGSLEEWEARAEQIRIDVLNKIMLRGVPDSWVEGPVNVEMLDPI